ncbi:HAMP domain-containing histidine kinase [Planktomarina temperata]|nr:HAMP domain-containing histidine kinase [Planktomarina temperata]
MNDLIVYRRNRWFMGLLLSPMTRRITFFHLLVLLLPAVGAFWLLQLHPDDRDVKRAQLNSEVLLLAQVVEGRLPHRVPVDFVQGDGVDLDGLFDKLTLPAGAEVIAFGPLGEQRSLTPGNSLKAQPAMALPRAWPVWLGPSSPVLLDHLAEIYRQISPQRTKAIDGSDGVGSVIAAVINGLGFPRDIQSQSSESEIWVAVPILHRQEMVGGIALGYPGKASDPAGRKMVLELALRLLLTAVALAIVLSVVSAWVMFGPVNRMADSVERFSNQLRHGVAAKNITAPNLPQRRDSIGRLSEALHHTIGALFIRIREAEAAVAEVTGEINNPMASMKSAIKALRLQKDPSTSAKLLDVIDNDLLRLERVTAPLTQAAAPAPAVAKEVPRPKMGKKERFELISLITSRVAALRPSAVTRGLVLTQSTPKVPVIIEGLPTSVGSILSAFLSNAIQRCAWGDEIRIWTRIQDGMVLVVVEDTGPPLPEGLSQTLFGTGNLATLGDQGVAEFTAGLAEAAQIVAAHSGVIRAEPVQPAGVGQAFGARFLFGLPV